MAAGAAGRRGAQRLEVESREFCAGLVRERRAWLTRRRGTVWLPAEHKRLQTPLMREIRGCPPLNCPFPQDGGVLCLGYRSSPEGQRHRRRSSWLQVEQSMLALQIHWQRGPAKVQSAKTSAVQPCPHSSAGIHPSLCVIFAACCLRT